MKKFQILSDGSGVEDLSTNLKQISETSSLQEIQLISNSNSNSDDHIHHPQKLLFLELQEIFIQQLLRMKLLDYDEPKDVFIKNPPNPIFETMSYYQFVGLGAGLFDGKFDFNIFYFPVCGPRSSISIYFPHFFLYTGNFLLLH